MPSNGLTAAIAEAYATARSDVIYYDTIQISNPLAGTIYLVADRQDQTFGLENDGGNQLFKASGFRFTLPASGSNGLQQLQLAIDNVDRMASDWVKSAIPSPDPVLVTYRPYISTDLTQPQMSPPLVLYLTDVVITAVEVQGTANFADILNRQFLAINYTRRRFPGLG